MHSQSSSLADEYYQQYSQQSSPAHSRPPSSAQVRKHASLAQINVPSFSAFRSQVPNNRPHAFHTSPRAASFSVSETASQRIAEPTSRPFSLISPLPQQTNGPQHDRILPLTEADELQQEKSSSYHVPKSSHDRTESIDSRLASTVGSSYSGSPRDSDHHIYEDYAHDFSPVQSKAHFASSERSGEQYVSVDGQPEASMNKAQRAPIMTVQHFDGPRRTLSDESLGTRSSSSQAERPKSPIGRLGTFFGWKSPQQKSEGESSPTTTFSERSLSPIPSPHTTHLRMSGTVSPARLTPSGLDIHKANLEPAYFENPDTPLLLGNDNSNAHVRELERELAHISQELAGSIRREMELEDELDRIRTEYPSAPQSEIGRRSSDYFSDSGASSARFPITDLDGKLEQLEKQVRKVEQEKANLKVETASRLQTELGRRRDLEELVHDLEDQLQKQKHETEDRGNVDERLSELETAVDEARRRLAQEKDAKENFEDLYTATREELERHRHERDNLRDEVLPRLRAQIEGHEAHATETHSLMDENSRMQQELAVLREECKALRETNSARFGGLADSIAEEGMQESRISPRIGTLSRSGSLARSTSLRRGGSLNKDGGRQRSGSTSVAHPDGVKEVEDQRDALHKALKLLIKRYERQQKDHERAVKKLTSARQRAELVTPQRSTYSREVAFLKEEVSVLRKRTEDALEQKWQYEKGLSGIKMDLDAAEQETRGLRILLQGHDISVSSPGGETDDDQSATGKLKLSISTAENERDQARKVAEEYRQRALETDDVSSEALMKSADRMEELASQLESHVQSNLELRNRLASAVAKGEQAQKESTRQIEEMQKRLAGMEDSVMAAQLHSENTLADHDADVRKIEDASSPRLQRLHIDIPDPSRLSPASSPMFKKSPKLLGKKLSETSLLEASQTQMLQRKVKELEGLLREAEEDVRTVVQRVNESQMEVADLQTERDAALTQMRKLQALVVEERERAEALM